MPDASEFHTAGPATLKSREAKVVRTSVTDNRLVVVVVVVTVVVVVVVVVWTVD